MTLRLAPSFIDLRPGQLVSLPPMPGIYRVEEVAIDGLVVIIQARRTHRAGAALLADPGRPVVEPDVAIGQSVPLLLDLPALGAGVTDEFGVVLALGCTGSFKPTVVEITVNGYPLARLSVARAAVTGRAVTMLGGGQSQLIDRVNVVDVQCANPAALLLHADADALAMGANAAMLGAELIQFARADATGVGLYRLSGLLRGRRATEWAMSGHAIDEPFVLLDAQAMVSVAMDQAMIGARVEARAYGLADDEQNQPMAAVTAAAENLRPLSPCHLRATVGLAGLDLSWLPRRVEALRWVTGADPDTSLAHYLVTLKRDGSPATRETSIATLALDASELATLGNGPLSIAIIEAGGGGSSRPALLGIAS